MLEVAKNKDFTKTVFSHPTKINNYVKRLNTGKYYFRVTSHSSILEGNTISKINFFQIVSDRKPYVLNTYTPSSTRAILLHSKSKDNGYLFSWEGHSENYPNTFIIAKNKNLKDIHFREEVRSNNYLFKDLLNEGKYYWTIQVSTNEGKIIAYSPPRKLSIKNDIDKNKTNKASDSKKQKIRFRKNNTKTTTTAEKKDTKPTIQEQYQTLRKIGKIQIIRLTNGRKIRGVIKKITDTHYYIQTIHGYKKVNVDDVEKVDG